MSMLANAILAAALAASGAANAADPAASVPRDATLRFISPGAALVGISFGMNAVDGRALILDQRSSTHLAGGRRTIWYSCPDEAGSRDSTLTFDFAPGKSYELTCRGGQAAQVRVAEGC